MGNYSFKTTGLPEPVNGVVEGHNLTQASPHTAIYAGQTGLTFKNCNLVNCDLPANAIVISCNRAQISFCSHLHDSWLAKGFLSACAVDCSHRTVVDTIAIDGISIDTNNTYQDVVI